MKTILTPIDFSTATEGVIEAACALANSERAQILLLHVVQPPVLTSDYGLALENFQEAVAMSEKHAAKRLAEFKERIQTRFPDIAIETRLVSGPPISEILNAVGDDVSLIVLGSHGHNAIYDLLVGSTTHGVLRKATRPVVIVPPPQRTGASAPAAQAAAACG